MVLILIVGFGSFAWLAIYLALRMTQPNALILSGVAALAGLAIFFGADAIKHSTSNRELYSVVHRWTMWSAYVPIAGWFHFCLLLHRQIHRSAPDERGMRMPARAAAAYTVAIMLGLIGGATDLLADYQNIIRQANDTFSIGVGRWYPVTVAFNAVLTGGALLLLTQSAQSVARSTWPGRAAIQRQLGMLIGGAVLFCAGALWLPLGFWLNGTSLPGVLLLYCGLAVVGYAATHTGLLFSGQNSQRDFAYSLAGILLLIAIYLIVVAAAGRLSVIGTLSIILLVILTHSAFDAGRGLLDRLFFSPEERRARREARAYATILGSQPVDLLGTGMTSRDEQPADEPPTDDDDPPEVAPTAPDAAGSMALGAAPVAERGASKEFKQAVRRAITDLKSPPQLARSPLLTLPLVTERLQHEQRADNRLNRAALLRELLLEYIEALRPTDRTAPTASDAWRFYNVLYYPYVREISRKAALSELRRLEPAVEAGDAEATELAAVLSWLDSIEEATFYKWQRRASDIIATSLWEDNARVLHRATLTGL
jgi:hypothetical protein